MRRIILTIIALLMVSASAYAIDAPALKNTSMTIPWADFKKILGIDSLLIGLGQTGDCIHSPNEKFDLACFQLGCRTHAALLAGLAV